MSKSEGEVLILTVVRSAIEFSKTRISFEILSVTAIYCVCSVRWEEE